MYKIIYIDEDKEAIDDFLDYFDEKDTNNKFNIQYLLPEKTLDGMYGKVFEENPDAIISDFKLNDMKTEITYNVPYTGITLTEKILENREKFPCFVMTSYDNEAIRVSQDVNLVYIKDILHGSEDKVDSEANFLDKVENQIIHYKRRIENSENKLLELIDKSNKELLNAKEEARLLELDTFIEKSTNQPSALPKHLKGTKHLDELHKMIDSTDELLAELRELKNGE